MTEMINYFSKLFGEGRGGYDIEPELKKKDWSNLFCNYIRDAIFTRNCVSFCRAKC